VVIGGDIHSFWVSDLKGDFRDPSSPTVATEFVGTSATSEGVPYDRFNAFLPENPHIRFFESRERGYVLAEVRPDLWRTDLRVVDTVTRPNAKAGTLRSDQAGCAPALPGSTTNVQACSVPNVGRCVGRVRIPSNIAMAGRILRVLAAETPSAGAARSGLHSAWRSAPHSSSARLLSCAAFLIASSKPARRSPSHAS
jgi:hypothetical protein